MAGSAFDVRFAASAVPALMAEHGRAVTRWPQGQSGAAKEVTGLWAPDRPSVQASQDGRRTAKAGTLQVAGSVEPDGRDWWVIDGETWKCDGDPPKAEGGLVMLRLVRVTEHRRSRNTGGKL